GVVEVRLHRAGAQHHVEREAATAGQVPAHDLVAPLGHPRDLLPRGPRMVAGGEPGEAEPLRDRVELAIVLGELGAGLVDVALGRAGELELATGLQRDRGAVSAQLDDLARGPAIGSRRPAELLYEPFEHRKDVLD